MNAPNHWGSGRIWSLWDMLDLYADGLVASVKYISGIGTMIEMVMERENRPVSEKSSKHITLVITRLERVLVQIDAPATSAATKEVKRLLKSKANGSEVAMWMKQILSRFEAELKGKVMLLLTGDETRRFNYREAVFGNAVDDAFPTAIEDIVEATKCSALARHTAVVFHIMRAMECAVQELSTELKIEHMSREWGKLLSDIKDRIEAMPKGDLRDSWSENYSLLYHVKQAWRNKTMHPKKTYTEEEADAVLAAAGSFMKHLAKLLPDASERVVRAYDN